MLTAIFWIGIAYILGSVPYGLVIAKTCCGIDPRTGGSGNTGATNVARLCGFGWGVATLACDLLKGALPVAFALHVLHGNAFFVSCVGLAAVLGHLFSCFMGLKGGKAVATSIGIFVPLAFWQLLLACAVCVLIIWRSGFVSLGSLSLTLVLPIGLACSGQWQWLPLSLVIMVLVYWSHRENIMRLLRGTEKSWMKKHYNEG